MTIKTKKGMASLYLVAFTTLLMGILTTSFVRVMLTESRESTNSDLSQSAYDSALAGIEDAKTAIIMYNTCRENSENEVQFNFRSRCDEISNIMEKSFEDFKSGGDGSCDAVPNILGIPSVNGAVAIGAKNDDGESLLNQSYTCVTVTNEADSFLTILGETTPSRTIPVRLRENEYSQTVAFEVEWYSRRNDELSATELGYMSNLYTGLYGSDYKAFGTKSDATGSLPVLAVEVIQTEPSFQMYQLDLNNEENLGTDHATVVLYPVDKNVDGVTQRNSSGGFVTNFISKDTVLAVSNKNSAAREQSPQAVFCAKVNSSNDDYANSGYRCRATIELPRTYLGSDPNGRDRAEHTFMIRVSLPYGVPEDTDVSIRACKALSGAVCDRSQYASWINQYVVDSTGRASTLYRRLTARIDTVNTIFIYPDYAAEARGRDATVEKDFYATKNCWATDDAGGSTTCANNGDAN